MINRTFVFLVIGSALLFCDASQAQTPSPQQSWNLDNIYDTQEEWATAVKAIQSGIDEIQSLQKQPIRSAHSLFLVLRDVASLRGKAGKLAKVGLLQHFTDTQNQSYLRRMEQSEFLETEVESAVSFINERIIHIPDDTLKNWLEQQPQLLQHQRRINRIKRLAPYKQDSDSEAILASLTRLPRTANDMYRAIMSADLNWPIFEDQPLTIARYRNIMRTGSDQQRSLAAATLLPFLKSHQSLIALALTRRIEGDSLIAKHRNLSSSIDTLLVLQDGLPINSHQYLFEAIKQNKTKLTYIQNALARAKGKDALNPIDFRALMTSQKQSFSDEKQTYPLSFAHEVTLQAAQKISPEYRNLMAQRLAQPWMHLADSPNKSDTVGVFWQVGGGVPHTILKYRDDYISFRLYSSAAFLMMGLANIPPELAPDRREEDLPVFSNALWYLGHFMQTDVLMGSERPDSEKKQILANQLTRSFNTLVNYAAMVKLEDHISQTLLNSETITAQDINDTYLMTLRAFMHNQEIEEHWQYAWMLESFAFYGPHYASFYQAISAALALKQQIDDGEENAIQAVQFGISNSTTHFSADVLQEADIALDNIGTYQLAIDALYDMAEMLNALNRHNH